MLQGIRPRALLPVDPSTSISACVLSLNVIIDIFTFVFALLPELVFVQSIAAMMLALLLLIAALASRFARGFERNGIPPSLLADTAYPA